MPRKEKRGTGITAYEITMYDAKTEGFPRNWGRNWNRAIKEGGGIFGAVSLQALRTCEHILANATGQAGEDSPEDFAWQVARFIRVAKAGIRDGNADLAARHAWDAGVLWATAVMKWQWEADALRGEKVAGGARNSAHEKNARHAARRTRRFARMAELIPAMGVDKAAAQVAAEGMGDAQAIKRQWNRHNQKKRDT